MKKFTLLLTVCALLLAGCKGGVRSGANGGPQTPDTPETPVAPDAPDVPETPAAPAGALTAKPFTFDELFHIFSQFGGNIMTKKFAPQSVKDGLKDDLEESFGETVRYEGACNKLACSLFDGDCYDGFEMACYRYAADGHVFVLLSEDGGCDVNSVKYIRGYEYDPEMNNAREVGIPYDAAPAPADFEDLVRQAGADVKELRGAAKAGLYNYYPRPGGLTVRLNAVMDIEAPFHGDLVVDYLWNGSEFVRNPDYAYACIHSDGFANIFLGRPAPDFNVGDDPKGYKVRYSEGGDLWLVDLDGRKGLEIQMEDGKVCSIETWLPGYCVSRQGYEPQPGKKQPQAGAKIADCITFGTESPQVWMLMDGTVQIEDTIWDTRIAFRTPRESLVNPPQPSANGKVRLENPQFKPDARIESILVWKEE